MKTKILTTVLLIWCYSGIAAQAQTDDEWKFLIEPYMMFPSMKGSTGIGDLPEVEVQADAGDIFGALKIGGMLYFEASTSTWSICSDIIYMNLEQDVQTRALIEGGAVQMKQFAWEVSGLRSVLSWLDVGIGLRLNSLKAGFDITTRQTRHDREGTETWVDPILIARSQGMIGSSKWIYMLRGDIGGFGIGSDFAWQIQPYIGYRFSDLFQLSAGYRVISMDYDTGSGDDYFKYDIDTSGPVVRFGFNLNQQSK